MYCQPNSPGSRPHVKDRSRIGAGLSPHFVRWRVSLGPSHPTPPKPKWRVATHTENSADLYVCLWREADADEHLMPGLPFTSVFSNAPAGRFQGGFAATNSRRRVPGSAPWYSRELGLIPLHPRQAGDIQPADREAGLVGRTKLVEANDQAAPVRRGLDVSAGLPF